MIKNNQFQNWRDRSSFTHRSPLLHSKNTAPIRERLSKSIDTSTRIILHQDRREPQTQRPQPISLNTSVTSNFVKRNLANSLFLIEDNEQRYIRHRAKAASVQLPNIDEPHTSQQLGPQPSNQVGQFRGQEPEPVFGGQEPEPVVRQPTVSSHTAVWSDEPSVHQSNRQKASRSGTLRSLDELSQVSRQSARQRRPPEDAQISLRSKFSNRSEEFEPGFFITPNPILVNLQEKQQRFETIHENIKFLPVEVLENSLYRITAKFVAGVGRQQQLTLKAFGDHYKVMTMERSGSDSKFEQVARKINEANPDYIHHVRAIVSLIRSLSGLAILWKIQKKPWNRYSSQVRYLNLNQIEDVFLSEVVWFAVIKDNYKVAADTSNETKSMAEQLLEELEDLLNFMLSLNLDIDFESNGSVEGWLVSKNQKLMNFGMKQEEPPERRPDFQELKQVKEAKSNAKILHDKIAQFVPLYLKFENQLMKELMIT